MLIMLLITYFTTDRVLISTFVLSLPFKDIGELDGTFTKSRRLAGLTYACPMAYIVEDGTS